MADELRVIDSNGEQAGIMLRESALSLAERQGFDLVLISPNADPPVAKIMDYGKYRYDQQKREKEAKKKQKIIEIKEIRLSTFIEQHDLEIKGTMAKKFLTEGDKLKVSLRFKGRERGRTDRGFDVMQRFADIIKDYGTPEKTPVLEGRSLIMIVNPLPPKKEAKAVKPEPAGLEEEASPEAKPEKADANGKAKPGEAKKSKPAETRQKKVKGPSDEMDI
jgi:translation initiation factor IF-3